MDGFVLVLLGGPLSPSIIRLLDPVVNADRAVGERSLLPDLEERDEAAGARRFRFLALRAQACRRRVHKLGSCFSAVPRSNRGVGY